MLVPLPALQWGWVPFVLPLYTLGCYLAPAINVGSQWSGGPSLTKAVMSSASSGSTGSASGMFYTFRNVGMALSLTLALVVAQASLSPKLASQIYLGNI